MGAVADDEPPSLDVLATYQRGGRVWVATDTDTDTDTGAGDRAVAYLLVDVVDGAAHIEQVSVDPAYAHRGLGRRLIDTAAEWAARQGLDALTLTTFTDVPWNAPYYARLGFAVVPDAEAGPGLLAVRRYERAIGLDAWPRQGMRRPVAG
jgi:ribosomal protein S18 acetylase RimI-like enzyme